MVLGAVRRDGDVEILDARRGLTGRDVGIELRVVGDFHYERIIGAEDRTDSMGISVSGVLERDQQLDGLIAVDDAVPIAAAAAGVIVVDNEAVKRKGRSTAAWPADHHEAVVPEALIRDDAEIEGDLMVLGAVRRDDDVEILDAGRGLAGRDVGIEFRAVGDVRDEWIIRAEDRADPVGISISGVLERDQQLDGLIAVDDAVPIAAAAAGVIVVDNEAVKRKGRSTAAWPADHHEAVVPEALIRDDTEIEGDLMALGAVR
jgi:hypothetical protein